MAHVPDSAVAPKGGAGAPESEFSTIEITPEMIEAGVEIFTDYDPPVERPADVVSEIFRTMARLQRT
jgi:hypothetical protein